MASIALQLKNHHQKTLLKSTHNLTFSHLFSSDNNSNNSPKSSNFSSYFSDIKSRLKNEQQQPQQPSNNPSRFLQQESSNAAKPGAGLDDIRKNLSEFRLPSGQTLEKPEKPTYFSNLYSNKNEATNGRPIGGNDRKGPVTFDAIRESLRQLRANTGNNQNQNQQKGNEPMSLNKYKENFRLSPPPPAADSGGLTEGLPVSVFGRELRGRVKGRGEEEVEEDDLAKIAFVKQYNNEELGMKLRELRPEVAKEAAEKGIGEENWFSFSELNERLKKLREIEVSQEKAKGGIRFLELRNSLQKIEQKTDDERANRPGIQRFDILGRISGQNFSMSPPKEHLIEKYFHPDNMSSAEKLKLELKKVRDEFKMHESDCGSTRVQIAVLTTEILHLSSVLHKKDKHSRRGLLAKVQQRKKLLKYLRRTDWDSYCFVLSRLGLRDNPDYKH